MHREREKKKKEKKDTEDHGSARSHPLSPADLDYQFTGINLDSYNHLKLALNLTTEISVNV